MSTLPQDGSGAQTTAPSATVSTAEPPAAPSTASPAGPAAGPGGGTGGGGAPMATVGPRLLLAQNRNFRWFWLARGIDGIGNQFFSMSMLISISTLTNNSLSYLAAASIGLALPSLVSSIFGGPLVDRYDRKRLLISLDGILGVFTGLIVVAFHAKNIVACLVLLFIYSLFGGPGGPVVSGLLKRIASPPELFSANLLMSMNHMVAMMAGPYLSGLVIDKLGIEAALLIDMATFFVAGLMILFLVKNISGAKGASSSFLFELRDGIRYLFKEPEIMGALYLMIPTFVGAGVGATLFVPFLKQLLGCDAGQVGFAHSGMGIGMFISVLVSNAGPIRKIPVSRRIMVASLLWCVGIMIRAGSPHHYVFFAGNILIGMALVPANAGFGALVQANTPHELVGRVSGVVGPLLSMSAMLGMSLAPALGAVLGLRMTFLSTALVVLAFLVFNVVRDRRRARARGRAS
jgi:predicted MFS family arabinose efflux permease